MTRTELERIAVLENKADTIDQRTERIEAKVDTLVEYMTTEKARRLGITEVFGLGRASVLLALPAITTVIAILTALNVL